MDRKLPLDNLSKPCADADGALEIPIERVFLKRISELTSVDITPNLSTFAQHNEHASDTACWLSAVRMSMIFASLPSP